MAREVDPKRIKTNGIISRIFAVVFAIVGVPAAYAGIADREWAVAGVGVAFILIAAFLWNVAKIAKQQLASG